MNLTMMTSHARALVSDLALAGGVPQASRTARSRTTGSRERHLLPAALAYLPVVIVGALLSLAWNVGASPTTGAADLPLRGTALAPPLFLPVLLLIAATAARRSGVIGTAGVGFCALVGLAFLGGSTLNLPSDLAAARGAGSPEALTIVMAIISCALAVTLLWHALPALIARLRR